MATDPYTYWRAALTGVFGPIQDGSPLPGFYKLRMVKDGPWLPVAIWFDGGLPVCDVNGEAADCNATWLRCARHPVDEDAYRTRVASGQWPDTLPAPTPAAEIGDNRPPETIEQKVAVEIEHASGWLAKVGEISSKQDGDIAANMRGYLLELIRQADAQREAEKKPHLDAGRAVDARWKPVIDGARSIADKLRSALTPWLNKLEAERKAAAAKQVAIGAEVARADTSAKAGGSTGKRASLRTTRRAVIRDYPAALQFFADHPDIKTTVERLCNKVAQVNGQVPGVEIVTERVAA